MGALATANNNVVEAVVALGLAARATDKSIENLVLQSSAEDDQYSV